MQLAEPNSGRLTVSLEPVAGASIREERTEKRLRKQIKRGSLKVGSQRVGTVTDVDGDDIRVDAGGLVATLEAPADEGPFAPGDRVMVRVESFDVRSLDAQLSFVPLAALPDDGDDEP